MRYVLHSVLREGMEEAYDTEHARVWPDLAQSLTAAGIVDWAIWRSGRHLFHLVECGDFAASMRRLEEDPVNRRWQEHINRFVQHFESGPAGDLPLFHVWTLSEQLADLG